MSAIDTYLENNARYARGFAKGDLPAAPAGRVAVVACMDARVDTAAILGLAEGDAHVIRNAGGVVTDDVIRSLAASQQLLGTREIMLIQHTDCGMQKLSDEEIGEILHERTGARPDFPMLTFSDVEASLRRSVEWLEANPLITYTDAIRAFVYEVETGRLREVT